ncbi:MAG: hypothetical protein HYY60_00160 [Parcubacteria group bacterium]|nr:hypothetical protein [Parcubacteria group bacterium]
MIVSKKMAELIMRYARQTGRISIEGRASDNGKFYGHLSIQKEWTRQPSKISTNAVFQSPEAAIAHMEALVERVREEAVLGS